MIGARIDTAYAHSTDQKPFMIFMEDSEWHDTLDIIEKGINSNTNNYRQQRQLFQCASSTIRGHIIQVSARGLSELGLHCAHI